MKQNKTNQFVEIYIRASINSASLKIVVSYLTTIYIFPIDDDEENAPIKFITRKLNASSSIITALYYHSTSQWIISGDEEGIGMIFLIFNLQLKNNYEFDYSN